MFDERKTVYFQLQFCVTNERKIKSINKLEEFLVTQSNLFIIGKLEN